MENIALVLGVFCCFQIGVCRVLTIDDGNVTVSTNKIEVKPGGMINLECYGNIDKLSFYIKNRAVWKFTGYNQEPINLTSSFYPTDIREQEFTEGIYKLDYGSSVDTKQYLFNMSKKEINHGDGGVYTCSLIGEKTFENGEKREVVGSQQSVHVIVLNPVEKVTLQIKDVKGARSTQRITAADVPIKVKPGVEYHVMCTAEGSNPAPVMNLIYNQEEPHIVPEFSNMTANKQIKHKAVFHRSITFDPSLGLEQRLICAAALPGGQYPPKEAGLKLHVSVDEPDIVCENSSAKEGYRRQKLSCNITTEHGIDSLSCDKVSWKLPALEVVIPTRGKTSYTTEDKSSYKTDCDKKDNLGIIQTTLEIYEVDEDHFAMLFYVKYDKYEIPVKLNKIELAAAHLVLPSLLTCLLVAVLSKLLAKSL